MTDRTCTGNAADSVFGALYSILTSELALLDQFEAIAADIDADEERRSRELSIYAQPGLPHEG